MKVGVNQAGTWVRGPPPSQGQDTSITNFYKPNKDNKFDYCQLRKSHNELLLLKILLKPKSRGFRGVCSEAAGWWQ